MIRRCVYEMSAALDILVVPYRQGHGTRRFRTNESPRFNLEVRSEDSVPILTGSPADSRPSQWLSSSGEACTPRPSWTTGILDFAQRCATETGCPKNAVPAFQRHGFSFAFWAHPTRLYQFQGISRITDQCLRCARIIVWI